jgi:hypothetical protein
LPIFARRADNRDRLENRNIISRIEKKFKNRSRCPCRNLESGLVGFHFTNNGFLCYRIAFFDFPICDDTGFYCVPLTGHYQDMRH